MDWFHLIISSTLVRLVVDLVKDPIPQGSLKRSTTNKIELVEARVHQRVKIFANGIFGSKAVPIGLRSRH